MRHTLSSRDGFSFWLFTEQRYTINTTGSFLYFFILEFNVHHWDHNGTCFFFWIVTHSRFSASVIDISLTNHDLFCGEIEGKKKKKKRRKELYLVTNTKAPI
jgi:hypothetical protein